MPDSPVLDTRQRTLCEAGWIKLLSTRVSLTSGSEISTVLRTEETCVYSTLGAGELEEVGIQTYRCARLENCSACRSTYRPCDGRRRQLSEKSEMGQTAQHQALHSDVNEGFDRGTEPLVVAAEAAAMAEPGEGPLDHPASGQRASKAPLRWETDVLEPHAVGRDRVRAAEQAAAAQRRV